MGDDLTSHRIGLARELLDDIEYSRLCPEGLLRKASRLARLVSAPDVGAWLRFELEGYDCNEPLAVQYMDRATRWIDERNHIGWTEPLAEICADIAAREQEAQRLDPLSPFAAVLCRLEDLRNSISNLSSIRSRVFSVLHDFVAKTYHELAFSGIAESIFEKHKTEIDILLRDTAGDALQRIPAIYERLAAGDREAVSHALDTCRRVMDGFVDAVYPPGDCTTDDEGIKHPITKGNQVNRIRAYLDNHCSSKSRRERLWKTFQMVRERASAGVHADVTLNEARSLFLQMYLNIGEILLVQNESAKNIRQADPAQLSPDLLHESEEEGL